MKQSLNNYLREEARKTYEAKLAAIPSVIKYHDMVKKIGEIFISRGYGRSYEVKQSSYAPTVVLRLESTAKLNREAQFLIEEIDDIFNTQNLRIYQTVIAEGLQLDYSEVYTTKFNIVFKLQNSKTCTIVETKKTVSYENIERTIIC